MSKAVWQGVVLAECDQCVQLEGNAYFPPDAVKREYLLPSETTTECSWKGTASYYHIEVNGQRNADAAWYYSEPRAAALEIRGRVAFWRGVKIEP